MADTPWENFTDRATLGDSDIMLVRDNGGGGVNVPGSAVLKKNVAGIYELAGVGLAVGTTNGATWISGGTGFNTGGCSVAFRGKDSTYNAGGIEFYAGTGATGQEAARIDGSRNFHVGAPVGWTGGGERFSVTGPNTNAVSAYNPGSVGAAFLARVDNPSVFIMVIYCGATRVGSITTNGSQVFFNTTSDRRLKHDFQQLSDDFEDLMDRIMIYDHAWLNREGRSISAIADELMLLFDDVVVGAPGATKIERFEVSPAVPATLDANGQVVDPGREAVFEEREVIDPQNVDYSKLVPHLIAYGQRQKRRVLALETALESLIERVAALEAAVAA